MARPTFREIIARKIRETALRKREPIIKKLLEAFSYDCNLREACIHAGISQQTYYNWIGQNPKLLEEFDAARNGVYFKARRAVADSVGDVRVALVFLEKKVPEEYGAKSKVEHSGMIATVPVEGEKGQAVMDKIVAQKEKELDEEIRKQAAEIHGK
jgi:hypothetical protein